MRLVVLLALALSTSIAAADDAPEVPPLTAITVSATSTLVQKGKTYEAAFALGGDPTKFWCEGKADEGIGEALVIKFGAPTKIESLTIRAGVWRSPELFQANNRITELDVIADAGASKKVTLREQREDIEVKLGRAPVTELRFQIAAVAKGKLNDTCISGIDVKTAPASTLVRGVDAAAVAALPAAFAQTFAAITNCTDKDLAAHLQFPFGSAEAGGRHSKKYRDAKAVKKACKDRAFSSFDHSIGTMRAVGENAGRVLLANDTLEWHFVLVGKDWKLASLVDETP